MGDRERAMGWQGPRRGRMGENAGAIRRLNLKSPIWDRRGDDGLEGHNGRDFFLNPHKGLPNSLPEEVVRVQEEIFGPVLTEPGPKSEVPIAGKSK